MTKAITSTAILKELRDLVSLSGLVPEVDQNSWKLQNPYWPEAYAETIVSSPWLLVRTSRGMVKLGWRKRVISIDWSDTPLRKVITADEVTKDETIVHAWGKVKALEYLTALAGELES